MSEGTVETPEEKWVHRRVKVAQPKGDHPRNVRDLVANHRVDDVEYKKWRPADGEAGHDDGEGRGRLRLLLELFERQFRYVFRLTSRRSVDLPIAHRHEGHGNVEGGARTDDGECDVDVKGAHALWRKDAGKVVLDADGVPLVHDGQVRDEQRQNPAESDQHENERPAVPDVQVRLADGQVAVEAHADQVEDGRRAQLHVDACGYQARRLAEVPLLVVGDLVDCERHHEERDADVGARQRHDQVVGPRV